MNERIQKWLLGLASTAIIALAGWLLTLYGWRQTTDMALADAQARLERAEARLSVAWQVAIHEHNELNRVRHVLGLEPIPWNEAVDRRLEAVTGD